ncbi:MAG: putative RDD family membrane protein YckC [Kiritimatiellia bacterium]|jgi:uncharacterized RDD family membrane protein YckC
MQWYYMKDGQQTGPFDDKAFNVLVESGEIKQGTQVWNAEMADWQSLESIAGKPRLRINKRTLAKPDVGRNYGRVDPDALVRGTMTLDADKGGSHIRYGGFFLRVIATFIDVIVVHLIIALFVGVGVGMKMLVFAETKSTRHVDVPDLPEFINLPFTRIGYSNQELYVAIGLAVMGVLSVVFYKPYWIGKNGATVGKKMLKMRVVRSDGTAITPRRAFGRYLAEGLSGIIGGIGYLMTGFDKEKRSLHDRIADTRVQRTL